MTFSNAFSCTKTVGFYSHFTVFVPSILMDNKSTMVQVISWYQVKNKPLPETKWKLMLKSSILIQSEHFMALMKQNLYLQTTCALYLTNGLWIRSIISPIGAWLPFDLSSNSTLHWWEHSTVGHATQYNVWMAEKQMIGWLGLPKALQMISGNLWGWHIH